MKKTIFCILVFVSFAFVIPDPVMEYIQSEGFKQRYRIDGPQYTNSAGIFNLDAALEAGSLLYGETALGAFGQTSCVASCHMPDNHLAPKGNQIGSGGANFSDGRKELKYFPTDLEIDAPAINAPQAENICFRKNVLHDGVTNPFDQIGIDFASFAHNIDFRRIIGNPIYEHYFNLVYGSPAITEPKFKQLILLYQESFVSDDNRFQEYLRGEGDLANDSKFMEGLALFVENCIDCHSGKDLGGGGMVMDIPVVSPKYEDEEWPLRSDHVLVRSVYNNDAFDKYGWLGHYSSFKRYQNNHIKSLVQRNKIRDLSRSERRKIDKWMRKNLND